MTKEEIKRAEVLMKRLKIGTIYREDANELHAECYGLIGKLLAERAAAQPATPPAPQPAAEDADEWEA